ncbi:MAG: hypothetical protein QOI41_1855 [Myxococcales bacterium]|nr:hypothetical protein [Myxococcales bacterium]
MRTSTWVAGFIVSVMVAFAALSCGGGGPPTAAPLPPGSSLNGWLVATLGGTPDASVTIRPQAARTDPYWGPLVGRVLGMRDHRGDIISHGSGATVLNAQQIDLHVIYRDPLGLSGKSKPDPRAIGWLGVIYGAVPFDPLAVRDGDGRPLFAPPFRMPSGVLVFFASQPYLQTFGPIAPTAFLLPNGTYVVADQTTAPRVQGMLAQSPAPPPALEMPPDSLGGMTFAVTSLRFVDTRSAAGAITQGMVAAGLGLRGGSGGSVDAYASYGSSDDAQRGYEALQRECASKPDSCFFSPGLFRDARASRDGSRLNVSLAFTDKLLSSIQSQADGLQP